MIYKLTSLNLTELGGRMGTETISINWEKYFLTKKAAKAYPLKENFKWKKVKDKPGWIKSPDLGYVQYTLEPITIEESP